MKPFERYLAPIGRILIGLFFLLAGIGKIADVSGVAESIASVGFPASMLLAILTIALEIGGGLMLITGFHGKSAALLLAGFVFIISFPFHGPATWADSYVEQVMFMKNIAIVGALLFMAAHIGKAAITTANTSNKPTPTL